MRRLLIASLITGAASAIVAWASFIAGFSLALSAPVYGWYVFWSSMAICTAAALLSAAVGWHVLSRPNSN